MSTTESESEVEKRRDEQASGSDAGSDSGSGNTSSSGDAGSHSSSDSAAAGKNKEGAGGGSKDGAGSGSGGGKHGGGSGSGGGSGKGSKADGLTYKFEDSEIASLRRELKLCVEIAGGLLEFGIAAHSLLVRALDAAGYGELFSTPAKVLAFQFVRTVDSLMSVLDKPDMFDNQLYNLAMRHINYVPIKVMIQMKEEFIRALNAALASLLEDEWTSQDNDMWEKFWGYCGAHIIATLGDIGGRVLVLRRSWNAVALLRNEDLSGGFGDAFYFNVGVMSAEVMTLIHTTRKIFGQNLNGGLDVLVKAASDPAVYAEELFVLATRHQTYGVEEKHFPIFAQAILVTLRTLLPREWDKTCEESWTWFFGLCAEGMVRNLADAKAYKEMLVESYKKVGEEIDIVSLGSLYYENFFTGNPAAQIFFNKPKTLIQLLVQQACDLLINIYIDGTETTRLIRALGIRHIKYGIPPEHFPSFGSALMVTFGEVLEGYWDDNIERGWKTVFDFTANCMARSVYSGTTLLTRALMRDSCSEIDEALDQAPRIERNLWMLEIDVSGIKVSPFFWGIQDAKYVVCTFMMKDITCIRADREKYYCGKDELFRVHRDIVEICASNSMDLLLVLFDGLVWECAKVQDGRRKVNYYLKDFFGDPNRKIYEDPYKTPLNCLVAMKDDRPFAHPLVSQLILMQWDLFGRKNFIVLQGLNCFLTLLFCLGFTWLDRTFEPHQGNMQHKGIFAFICRCATVLLLIAVFIVSQFPRIMREIRLNQTSHIHIPLMVCDVNFQIPRFFTGVFNVARLVLVFIIALALCFDNEFTIWMSADEEIDTDNELLAKHVRSWCVGFGSIIVLLQTFEVCDISLELSKLRQRVIMVSTNFLIFCSTLLAFLAAFGIAMWAAEPLKGFGHNSAEFATFAQSVASLLHTLYGIFSFHIHSAYSLQMFLIHVVYAMCAMLVLQRLILGLFVDVSVRTQLKLGRFAYMRRGASLIELNSARSLDVRKAEWASLNLDQRIEFDDGDLGVTGGISVNEDVATERMRHDRTIGDRIIRYVGVCSDRLPWPKMKATVVGVEEICGKIDTIFNDTYRDLKSVQRRLQGDVGTGTGTGDGSGIGRSGTGTRSD